MKLLHHDAKVDRLAAIPLFAGASQTALKHLATAADEASVPAGSTLIHQGHDHHEGYLIMSGVVEVIVDGEKVAEIGEGELVGELGLFGQRPASATVKALTPVDTLIIPYNRFDQILDDNPTLTKAVAIKLAARLHHMDLLHRSAPSGKAQPS